MKNFFRFVHEGSTRWVNLDNVAYVTTEGNQRDKARVHFNHAGGQQSEAAILIEGRDQVATLARKLDA